MKTPTFKILKKKHIYERKGEKQHTHSEYILRMEIGAIFSNHNFFGMACGREYFANFDCESVVVVPDQISYRKDKESTNRVTISLITITK